MAPRIRSIFKNLFTRAYLRDSFEKKDQKSKKMALSRRKNKRRKGRTTVRKWRRRRWRRESRFQRAARSTSRSST
jgi:hypothetical protein